MCTLTPNSLQNHLKLTFTEILQSWSHTSDRSQFWSNQAKWGSSCPSPSNSSNFWTPWRSSGGRLWPPWRLSRKCSFRAYRCQSTSAGSSCLSCLSKSSSASGSSRRRCRQRTGRCRRLGGRCLILGRSGSFLSRECPQERLDFELVVNFVTNFFQNFFLEN